MNMRRGDPTPDAMRAPDGAGTAGDRAAALRAAEAVCAAEPIHIPGAIQPHGMLVAIERATLVVAATSANVPVPARSTTAGGHTLGCILTQASAARVAAALATNAGGTEMLDGLAYNVAGNGVDGNGAGGNGAGGNWIGLLRPADGSGLALLELEPDDADDQQSRSFRTLETTIDALARVSNPAQLSEIATASLRAMTGFDRVMAYRFMPDWSGAVIAESLAAKPTDRRQVDSFLGLRFPASDIPAQARALYRDNRIRSIPDVQGRPIPLVAPTPPASTSHAPSPPASTPIDLSQSSLRAVSPVHLAYLENMGVRASMSVAINRQDGSLWGLLACHHQDAPLFVGHRTRQVAEMLGRVLSWRLGEIEASDVADGRARIVALGERLALELGDPDRDIESALVPLCKPLASAVGAGAFALCLETGDVVCDANLAPASPGGPASVSAGASPGGVALSSLADRLAELFPDGLADTETLDDPAFAAIASLLGPAGWCGLLALRVIDGTRGSPGIWAVWLRPELRRDVVWAGNPEKEIADAAPGTLPALTPRRSFAAWHQETRGRASAFSSADRAAARAIADRLARCLQRRAAAAERSNVELRLRNEAIRFFADAAVHDLREPLWQIQVFAGMLNEELAANPDLSRIADTIETSALRMRDMVDDLAHYAAAGCHPERVGAVGIGAIIDEAVCEVSERFHQVGGTLDIAAAAIPDISCDQGQMRRVFQNLLSNAVKYRSPNRTLAVRIATALAGDDGIRITVSDNGLGFDPSCSEQVFEPFRRLHAPTVTADTARPGGLGLGLAICRRILEGHDGTIVANSVPGEGSTFTVTLPLSLVVAEDGAGEISSMQTALISPAGPTAGSTGEAGRT